ncbi:hypothetical protein ACFU7T_25375 [Streptomyces sp. NPDC057555]
MAEQEQDATPDEQSTSDDELIRRQQELAEQVNRHFELLHGKGRAQ